MHENIKAAICGDWCDLLSKYQLQEVRDGVAALFRASKGKLRSLNEFQVEEHIRIEHLRQIAMLPKTPAEPSTAQRQPPTPEERARVAAMVSGFAKSTRVKPMQPHDQTQKNINDGQEVGR